MSSGDASDDDQDEHRLLEYDTAVPVQRRVACSCGYGRSMSALPSPEAVEKLRRSVAMLTTGQWALKWGDSLVLLRQLHDAVEEPRRRDPR